MQADIYIDAVTTVFGSRMTVRFDLDFQYEFVSTFLYRTTSIHTLRSNTMSTAVKASRIDESLWVRHQPMIERLYIKEHKRLEGKDGVLEYMRKHHNFAARYACCLGSTEVMLTSRSKSQYENHFKKWRLRKNLTSVEWRQTIRHMKQNSLSGEQVKLLFKGAEIPRERIIREIARYGSTYYRDGLDNEGDKRTRSLSTLTDRV
jgi:hypothetical protein